MPIVKNVVERLVCPESDECVSESGSEGSGSTIPGDPDACLFTLEDKDKFLFCIQYRGKPTEQLAHSFKKINAPCKIIMKTRKIKSFLPPLKPAVPKMLRSAVVYKSECPGCDSSYVGQTVRHMQRRFKYHVGSGGTCMSQTIDNFNSRTVIEKIF